MQAKASAAQVPMSCLDVIDPDNWSVSSLRTAVHVAWQLQQYMEA